MSTLIKQLTLARAIGFLMLGMATVAAMFGYSLVMAIAEMLRNAGQ